MSNVGVHPSSSTPAAMTTAPTSSSASDSPDTGLGPSHSETSTASSNPPDFSSNPPPNSSNSTNSSNSLNSPNSSNSSVQPPKWTWPNLKDPSSWKIGYHITVAAAIVAIVCTIVGTRVVVQTYNMEPWKKLKDFRDDCRSSKASGGDLTKMCEDVLSKALPPPPDLYSPRASRLIKRGFDAGESIVLMKPVWSGGRSLDSLSAGVSGAAVTACVDKLASLCVHQWIFDYALMALSLAQRFHYHNLSKLKCIYCFTIPAYNQLTLWSFWCGRSPSGVCKFTLLPDLLCFAFIFVHIKYNDRGGAHGRVIEFIKDAGLTPIWDLARENLSGEDVGNLPVLAFVVFVLLLICLRLQTVSILGLDESVLDTAIFVSTYMAPASLIFYLLG